MHNKKLLTILALFVLIIISTLSFSLMPQQRQSQSQTEQLESSIERIQFEKIDYYKTKARMPYMHLNASTLVIEGSERLDFSKPKGSLYSDDKKVIYSADTGTFTSINEHLELEGHVDVIENKNSYKSKKLDYSGKSHTLEAVGDVRALLFDELTKDTMNLSSVTLVSFLDKDIVQLSGDVKGKLERHRKYEEGFMFSAGYMEFNGVISQMSLTKSVIINRNNYTVSAQSAQIFLENFNKKLKYYSLYDDVKLVEKIKTSGTVSTRRAYAEKLEAFQNTGKIILTGAPRVEQGDDVIKGYQITLRENVELVEVDDSQSSFSIKRKSQ